MAPAEHAFGPFAFDPHRRLLTRGGTPVEMGQRAADLLLALLEAKGQPVGKAELMDRVWPGLAVEDGNLAVQIAGLRKLLGQGPQGQDWIVTVPRLGYRLIPITPEPVPKTASTPLLAVMPFGKLGGKLGGDAEQDYFADGIVEDLIIALSRFRSFAVIARNSSFAYRDRRVSAGQAARELGVRYVLDGTVRHSGERFRISAHLIDVETEANLWAANFDGKVEDIFEVQDRITASVAAHVAPQIEHAEIERSRRKPPGSLAAYDYYLRALQMHNTYAEADNREALIFLEKAIALAPDFGPALASAAYGYEHRVTMGWPPASADDRAKARQFARAAIAAAPDDALVLARAGFIMLAIDRDYDLGLQTILRAAQINPNNVTVLFVTGVGHIWAGDLHTALETFRRVVALSPGQTSGAMGGMSHVLICMGRYEEALDWARKSLAENPRFDVMHWLVTSSLGHLGRHDEAALALAALQNLSPGTTIAKIHQSNQGKYPERWDIIVEGLRLAGMPEGSVTL